MALVAVDVGGTNVRFAVAGASGLGGVRSMLCADYPSLAAAFAAYAGETGVKADAASIAVAGPVQAPHVDVTNNHWQFSKAAMLVDARLERLLVVNDFTAQALAQTDPSAHGNLTVLPGTGPADVPLLVVGPGTGLGVSALVPAGDGYLPIEGEGGHVGMSPQSEAEMALLQARKVEVSHVSAEDFVSGPGLENVYRLQTGIELRAPEIGKAAVASDGPAREALLEVAALKTTLSAAAAEASPPS